MVEHYRSCVFLPDVMCSHRRSKSFSVSRSCFKCPHYAKFMRIMEEQDEIEMAEIDRIRKYGYDVPAR